MSKSGILDCLYPNKCAGCDEIMSGDDFLCKYCSAEINKVNYKNTCAGCGFEKEYCRCGFRAFHYSGAAGAFKNTGVARKTYYSYKLGRREELSPYFAKKAAEAVRAVFGNIDFDAVCCVPASRRSRLKRGFDHGETIAEKLAGHLGAEFLRGILKTRHLRPFQHKGSFAKRLENARGKYYTVKQTDARRILLFDDICTTGATLDECARELMFAGAREVYCAVILMTYPNKKVNGGK